MTKRRALRVKWVDYRRSREQIIDTPRDGDKRVIFSGCRCLACGARLYRFKDAEPVANQREASKHLTRYRAIELEHLHAHLEAVDIQAYPPLAWNFHVHACAWCAWWDKSKALRKAVADKAKRERNNIDIWLESSYLGVDIPVPGPDAIFSNSLKQGGADKPER